MIVRQLLIGMLAGIFAVILMAAATRPRQIAPGNQRVLDVPDISLFVPDTDLPQIGRAHV